MRVSASMMSTWMKCPLQAKYRYVDRSPQRTSSAMVFGTCVHSAMEFFAEKRDRVEAVEWFLRCWDDPSTIGEKIEYWNKRQNFGSLRERGQLLLEGYFDRFEREDRRIIAVEHPFKVAIGDHEISGKVDLLEWRRSGRGKNQLRITDYKTGKKPWKDALRNNIQFTAYYYASLQPEFWIGYPGDPDNPGLPDGARLYEEFRHQPRQAIWWSLPTDEEIDAGERTDEDFKRMYLCIEEMSRAIEHEVFVPCISGDTCTMCDFTQECGVVIPSAADRLNSVEPF
jgi:CRISPR/Cas system-associated exonuclease Cas4 (RecB family)